MTQLGSVPGLIQQLVDYLDDAFGATPASAALVLGTVGVFAGGGFLVGYLWARFYMGRALHWADTGLTAPTVAAQVAKELALEDEIREQLKR